MNRAHTAAYVALLLTTCLTATTHAQSREEAVATVRAAERHIEDYREQMRTNGVGAPPQGFAQEVVALERAIRVLDETPEGVDARFAASRMLRSLGRSSDSLAMMAQAEEVARRVQSDPLLAKVVLMRTFYRLEAGEDPSNVEAAAIEGVRLTQSADDADLRATALSTIAYLDIVRRRTMSAKDWYDQAIMLRPRLKDDWVAFEAITGRTSAYKELSERSMGSGAHEVSLKFMELWEADLAAAVEIASRKGWKFLEKSQSQMLRMVRMQTEVARGKTRIDQQLRDLKVSEPTTVADVQFSTKLIDTAAMEDFAPIAGLLQQWDKMGPDSPERTIVRANRLLSEGKPEEALAEFMRAAEFLETDYRECQNPHARAALIGDANSFYFTPMLLQLQAGKTAEAFDLMERARARSLQDVLSANRRIDLADPQRKQKLQELTALRALLGKKTSEYESRLRAGAPPSETGPLAQEVTELRETCESRTQDIRRTDPELLGLVAATPLRLADLERAAREGRFDVLEYFISDSTLIAWHIGPSGVHVGSIDAFYRPQLQTKIEKIRESAANPRVAFDAASARHMFLYLIAPFLGDITTEHLVIIPHQELFRAPFQVFIDPADQRFVGERWAVSYAPSAGVLLNLTAAEALGGSKAVAFAGPGLKEAREEAQAVAELLADGSRVLAPGDEAGSLAEAVNGWPVVHLASHCVFDQQEPLSSYLELWPSLVGESGRIDAALMFGLPLRSARLVTLSSCESAGTGDLRAGEMNGIPRALLFAGAQSLLLTQWPIDSAATLQWMKQFYTHARRESPTQAQRLTIRDWLASDQRRHPYYWAAFYLVGR